MDISDEQWAVVRRFLPGPERLRTSGKGGRPWRDPVADELISPCPLVAEAGALLAKAKPSKEGLVSRRDRRCLDVHVSPAILGRALRILDALLKGLEQRGYTIETTVPRKEERTDYYGRREQIEHPTRTLVHIGGEEIAFDLAEETEFTRPPAKRPPPDPDHKVYWAWRNAPLPPRRATGALTLSMKDVCDVGRKSWTDCVKRGEADVLLSRRSGSPSWVRTGDPLVNRRVPIGSHADPKEPAPVARIPSRGPAGSGRYPARPCRRRRRRGLGEDRPRSKRMVDRRGPRPR